MCIVHLHHPVHKKYTLTLPPPALCFKFLVDPTWGKWLHWIHFRLVLVFLVNGQSLWYCVLSISFEVTFRSRKYNTMRSISKLLSSLFKSKLGKYGTGNHRMISMHFAGMKIIPLRWRFTQGSIIVCAQYPNYYLHCIKVSMVNTAQGTPVWLVCTSLV